MRKNKKLIFKLIMLICLIGICFAPIVYADEAYILSDTKIISTGEVGGTMYLDQTSLYIPFTQVGEPQVTIDSQKLGIVVLSTTTTTVTTEEATMGDLKFTATTTQKTTTQPGVELPLNEYTKNYSVTLPDGTPANNVKITFTNADGTTSTVEIPSNGGILDLNSNIKLGLDYPVSEDTVMTMTYTDAAGNEYTTELGNVGNDIETVDMTVEPPNALAGVGELIGNAFDAVASFIEEILVELFLPLGDGIVYFISASVGEVITTDSLIFNKVEKLNINYWDSGSSNAVKSVLQDVVNKWYAVFFKIAIIVYMIVLVVAGIQILLHSTAEKTAQYKEYFVSWVIGVAILCLFPYAMKYVVLLSETAVTAVSGKVSVSTPTAPAILTDREKAMELFGEPEFVTEMNGGSNSTSDSMLYIRAKAQESKKFILVAIYFILIGQMLVLLLMYYKRAFMIAFLITIFPLVAMTYAIDKMGDKKAQSFSIWFKEFIVNVVVQLFHAVVYVIVVNTSVQTFISTEGKNWLFMLISVLFLFQGEKILRSIFSVESKANTIGDLATTAATYTAMAGLLKGGGSKDNIASKQDAADMSAIKERNASRASWRTGAVGTVQAINSSGDTVTSPSPSTQGSDNAGQYRGDDPDGVNTNGFDSSAALDKVTQSAMQRRVKSGLASKAAKFGANAVGGIAGATYGMSKGDAGGKMASNMIKDSHLGAQLAKGALTPVTSAINIAERRIDGARLASDIKKGDMDKALNLDAMTDVIPPNVNPDEVANKYGEDTQKIFREALAAAAKAGSKGGRAKAEAAYWNYMKNNTKK